MRTLLLLSWLRTSRKQAVAELARYAAVHEHVRFDLVVIRPEEARQVSSRRVLNRLRGNILRDLKLCSEMLPVAFVILYAAAVEDLLVSAAAKKQVEVDHSGDLLQLAEYLHERGVITPVIVTFAKEAREMRNRVMHVPGSTIGKEEAKQRLADFRRLVTDYGWTYDQRDSKA